MCLKNRQNQSFRKIHPLKNRAAETKADPPRRHLPAMAIREADPAETPEMDLDQGMAAEKPSRLKFPHNDTRQGRPTRLPFFMQKKSGNARFVSCLIGLLRRSLMTLALLQAGLKVWQIIRIAHIRCV